MTYGAFKPRDPANRDLPPLRGHGPSLSSKSHAMLCAAALVLGTAVGLSMLYTSPLTVSDERVPPMTRALAAARAPSVATPTPARSVAKLFDPAFDTDHTPVTFDQTILLAARFEPLPPIEQDTDSVVAAAAEPPIVPQLPIVSELVQDVPLPMPRPPFLSPDTSRAMRLAARSAPASPPDRPNFFEKLFGSRQQPTDTALAYAAPDDFGIGRGPVARTLATYGQRAAVYDIAAHTVYLPSGARLEAHSGLGSRLDDPRSVAEHMRGATPPAVYDLTLREQPFHGVRALRLNPIGGGTVYGRAGLLAHTFMLGPRGDSNGCVVFRDYRSFLQAYESGAVNRLVVVSSLN